MIVSSEKQVIGLKKVSILRGGKEILHNINWSTQKGEHWFVMGANGCGKTTLIEILVGYLWPQQGRVSVMGETFGRTNLLELRSRVGYVSSWIFKRMPTETLVEDVVASGRDGSVGVMRAKDRALRVAVRKELKFFGCLDLLGRTFGTLSSGQQLKCILARAMIHRPGLIILDEPFSLLDVGARLDMYEHVTRLCRGQGAPQLIIVTHHKEDLLPILTHGLILKEGKILVKGTRSAVLKPKVLSKAFDVDRDVFKRYFY